MFFFVWLGRGDQHVNADLSWDSIYELCNRGAPIVVALSRTLANRDLEGKVLQGLRASCSRGQGLSQLMADVDGDSLVV